MLRELRLQVEVPLHQGFIFKLVMEMEQTNYIALNLITLSVLLTKVRDTDNAAQIPLNMVSVFHFHHHLYVEHQRKKLLPV